MDLATNWQASALSGNIPKNNCMTHRFEYCEHVFVVINIKHFLLMPVVVARGV